MRAVDVRAATMDFHAVQSADERTVHFLSTSVLMETARSEEAVWVLDSAL